MTRKRYLIKIMAIACLALAAMLFAWSLTEISVRNSQQSAVQKVEQRLNKKLQEAKSVGEKLCAGESVSLSRSNISAFCFVNGHLQSWTSSDVPIDETLLAAIDTTEQFVQLGQMWYVTHAYIREETKIVTAVLVKKDYAYENNYLQPKISGFLHLPRGVKIDSVNVATPHTIYGSNEMPLFTLVFDEQAPPPANLLFRWLAVLLVIITLFLLNAYYASTWICRVSIVVLALLRVGLFIGKNLFENSYELFSSTLYADSVVIPSLGDLLLHALFVFLITIILLRQYKLQSKKPFIKNKHTTFYLLFAALTMALACSIHYVWRSLLLNSIIPLDLSRLDQLTGYTFVAYGAMVLLFAALGVCLYVLFARFLEKSDQRIKLRGWLLAYIVLLSLYLLAGFEIYNHRRENLHVKVWADKLVTEHDPTAELLLNDISKTITSDTILKQMVHTNTSVDTIHRYMQQHYFNGYMQYYDLQLTICPRNTKLQIDTTEVDCRAYFIEEIEKYGTRLNDSATFYYLANDNGRNSYIGFITMSENSVHEIDLFLELDSKLRSGGDGYPELLTDHRVGNRVNLPAGYSYANYTDGLLITSFGNYRYPNDNSAFATADKIVESNYTHLLFRPDTKHLIVVTRHTHTFWSLLILFSYMLLLIGIGLFVLLFIAGVPLKWQISHNTFQRKITVLIIVAFVLSILCIGTTTVWYNIRQFRSNAIKQMEDKMRTVLVQLDFYFHNTHDIRYVEPYFIGNELVRLSNSTHIDINIYDTNGQLFVSSRMEIFDKHLQSERINRTAFGHLRHGQQSEFIHKEKIGDLSFYSVYASYYNKYGELAAYINVPYFSKRVEDIREASAVVTTMVNFYILALFIALLIGAALASRLLRPLEIVRRNMQRLDVSKKMEHIRYDEKDELGDLIRAYNQMVDALEESTRKLAQSERESAWREMARQIAHEIKNPLTPMRLSIQHLVRLKNDNAPNWQARFDELATALLEQIDTLAKTASEFSNFAKTSNNKAVSVSLNNLLNELRSLFDTHKNITFEWREEVKNATIQGHPDQLSRVLVNLLTNAVQAVQEKPDGKIRVVLSETTALNDAKKYYCITIDDNGEGVPSDSQEKLFTPNFTTKSSGTGLGLAISRKIVEEEGGLIIYTASDLGGACFMVKLPTN